MSLTHSPKIVTDGLVMYYDMTNGKSFVGAPITNLLDGASVNGYPTYGNGWGTYNTNSYGSGTYYSIGTIASVSGNVVATSSAHGLYSYNVMTPQTSGGGVSAGTNYLIKKLSDTTFTLHPWNGSGDGSQGYINPVTGTHKVFDDFANDVRISVSASGFPTMWWGPPHLPNSCLVKEIIPSGFTGILGRAATDCVRLHWIQPDGRTDGMAYGPNGPVVAGQVYTVSFWTRSVTPSAVGQSLSYQIYNHGVVAAAGYSFGAVLGPVGVWTKQSMTFTPVNPNCISYWFPSTGNMKVDVANIQIELGSVANNFVAGTRSSAQSILNVAKKTNASVQPSNVVYSSNGTFNFNGTSSVLLGGDLSASSWPVDGIANNYTVELWFKPYVVENYRNVFDGTGAVNYGPRLEMNSAGNLAWMTGNSAGGAAAYNVVTSGLQANRYHHVCITMTGNVVNTYYNGVNIATATATYTNDSDRFYSVLFGRGFSTSAERWFKGEIAVGKIYNRALSAAEVEQNFQALKERFFGYQILTFATTGGSIAYTNNGTEAVSVYKTSGNGSWDSGAYCTTQFSAPCTFEFTKNAAAGDNGASYAMIGWNEDPNTSAGYGDIDNASYPYSQNSYYTYNNGAGGTPSIGGTWDPAQRFYIVYDTDGYIRHYNGAKLLHSVLYGTGKSVYIDMSLYNTDTTYGKFTNIQACSKSWNGSSYT